MHRHVCIIEIKGDQYRCLNLPLYTTRPFVISDITLSEHVDAGVPHTAETVEQLLTEQIDNMLERVKGRPVHQSTCTTLHTAMAAIDCLSAAGPLHSPRLKLLRVCL